MRAEVSLNHTHLFDVDFDNTDPQVHQAIHDMVAFYLSEDKPLALSPEERRDYWLREVVANFVVRMGRAPEGCDGQYSGDEGYVPDLEKLFSFSNVGISFDTDDISIEIFQ